jgi:hypothetical protein
MSEERLYTFNELLERLMLTDEELLLCKQHRDYNKKLNDMLEGRGNCDNRGNIGDPPDEPKVHNRGWDEHYGA